MSKRAHINNSIISKLYKEVCYKLDFFSMISLVILMFQSIIRKQYSTFGGIYNWIIKDSNWTNIEDD